MKINTAKIEGYENMTLEQKLSALENYEADAPDYSGYIAKETFDKTASELATLKKQLREKMSAEELKAKEDAEKIEELIKERDSLLREKTVAAHKAKYLALGYDENLASDAAEAIVKGDFDKVFTIQKKHLVTFEKTIREDVLHDTPKPEGGAGKNKSAEDIMKISDSAERQSAIAENIELFN